MQRSKFNVAKAKEGRTYDGITFDSEMELRYYRDVILPQFESGEIVRYERQKKYILQEGFIHNGVNVRPIDYKADFCVEYKDGRIQVVDVKGFADKTALIKRKMFWYKYPNVDYVWLTYVKKYGGWIEYEDYKNLKKKTKKDLKEKKDGTK